MNAESVFDLRDNLATWLDAELELRGIKTDGEWPSDIAEALIRNGWVAAEGVAEK
ncbi:MAG TPA: hypothetical protein VFU07_07215 [Candidatus Lumbricidophila sp.]|nr:hypothetical protein [Candidatus Lumbricidophila sp.]